MIAVDVSRSVFTINTRAKGMLAKFAHDLALRATPSSVVLTPKTPTEVDGAADFELRFSGSAFEVVGVHKNGKVDTTVLSASDCADIRAKIRSEVLTTELIVKGTTEPVASGSVRALGTISVGARSIKWSTTLGLAEADGSRVARGNLSFSLPSLGISPPKGPLGAFRVDDDVNVEFVVHLTA